MSHAPSTFGTMITSSRSPIAATRVVMVPKVEGAWDIHYVDRLLAQLDVGLLRDRGQLGDELLVRRVEEVDHARGPDRDLEQRSGRALGERLGEVAGVAHDGDGRRRRERAAAVQPAAGRREPGPRRPPR